MGNFEKNKSVVDLILKDGSFLDREKSEHHIVLHSYHLQSAYSIIYVGAEDEIAIQTRVGVNRSELQPVFFGLLGEKENDLIDISPLHVHPYTDLRGRGVLLGFVDTGIDYTLDAFRYEDGSSKVACIWDQTLEGTPPDWLHFGA